MAGRGRHVGAALLVREDGKLRAAAMVFVQHARRGSGGPVTLIGGQEIRAFLLALAEVGGGRPAAGAHDVKRQNARHRSTPDLQRGSPSPSWSAGPHQ